MTEWGSFFLATAGASAGLTGLIFVSISINISKILSDTSLINRAFLSISLLITSLVVSLLFLIPFQAIEIFGLEIFLLAVISWVTVTWTDIKIYRSRKSEFRKPYLWNITIDQISLIPYIIAGFILLTGSLSGIGWIATGIIFSLLKSILDSWVLLVEINR